MAQDKIGIFTFHFAHNYGAQLQAYGLSHKLKQLGYNVRIVDYRLRYIYRWKEIYNAKTYFMNQREDGFSVIRSFLRTIRHYPELIGKQYKDSSWDRYESFMKNYLPLSRRVYSWQLDNLGYDTLICGSDQIWNLELTGGFSDAYFLNLKGCRKRISYAGSTGTNGFEFGEEDKIMKALSIFNALSCREKGLSETVSTMTGKPVTTVCDPVFLLNKDEWSELLTPSKILEPYILIYAFNETSEDVINTARCLSKRYGFKIYRVTGKLDERIPKENNILNAGPREFLTLFAHAQFVVTNTFHGVATSLIMNRQFFVIPPSFRKDRVTNIIERFGLQDRVVEGSNDLRSVIDYNIVNPKIHQYREESINFLKVNL